MNSSPHKPTNRKYIIAVDKIQEQLTSHVQHAILANGTDYEISDPWGNEINALDFILRGTNVE